MPTEVRVRLTDGGEYPVLIGAGVVASLPERLRAHAPAHRYALLADAQVAALHGAKVQRLLESLGGECPLLTFPAGESEKNRDRWAELTDGLLAEGLGRDSCIVALGGGVTGDLAGFVAATFLRGVPVVQIPTSIVAMVDSSVGGKTGVDLPVGKNLVGAFHPPRLVLVDPELALTLPRAERSQGLAEAVKHGAIVDFPYLERLEAEAPQLLAGEVEATTRAVLRSIEIKAGVVSQDEREGGIRQILNFGHTLGHALEQASGYSIPHGSAVARGMVLEARLGESLGVTAPGVADRLARALRAVDLPTEGPLPASPAAIVALTRADKKARGGVVRYVLLDQIGRVDPGQGWSHPVPEAPVLELLEAIHA
jgi:3-dehydroquinate synthase